jgi:hypothetical protein
MHPTWDSSWIVLITNRCALRIDRTRHALLRSATRIRSIAAMKRVA